jgi:hypothetical protein
MKSHHSQVNGWNWRTSSWARLARLRRPKIVCSPSYVDFRSRTNAVMWLDLGHMTRREHIQEEWGGNPKLESVWCPHCRGTNTVILKWQRSVREGDWEVVKRSGRDESIRVVIHLCMEAMLGISLYNYPYLRLAKTLCLSFMFMSSLQQNWRRVQNSSACKQGGWRKREVAGSRREKWPKQCMHIWIHE